MRNIIFTKHSAVDGAAGCSVLSNDPGTLLGSASISCAAYPAAKSSELNQTNCSLPRETGSVEVTEGSGNFWWDSDSPLSTILPVGLVQAVDFSQTSNSLSESSSHSGDWRASSQKRDTRIEV